MKIQDLINELEEYKKQHGNTEVKIRDRECYDLYEPWLEVDQVDDETIIIL